MLVTFVKSAEKVRMIVPRAATPVGVTNLISWFAAVEAFKEDMVSDKLVSEAANAILIWSKGEKIILAISMNCETLLIMNLILTLYNVNKKTIGDYHYFNS